MNDTTPYEEGDPNSEICIVGEAPGHVEIRLSRPLVGPSGRLLERCLHAAGIARRECYLTNVFGEEVTKRHDGCSIVDSKGTELWHQNRGFTDTGVEKAEACVRRLRTSKANVFVPLGNTALDLLCGTTGITLQRGSVLPCTLLGMEGRKVLPTIHPAAVLRGQTIYHYVITEDLRRVRVDSAFPELRLPERNYRLRPTLEEALTYMQEARHMDWIGFDIETYARQVSCFGVAKSPTDTMCIPLVERGDPYWQEEEEVRIWEALAELLGDEKVGKIGQNLIFDIHFLLKENSILTRGRLADTMVAHSLMFPDLPKGLDFLASVYTREPYYKDDRKMWNDPYADPEKFWTYNAKDAAVTYEVWNELKEKLDKDGYQAMHDFTTRLYGPLCFMMLRGFKVDLSGLENTKKTIAQELEAKQVELDTTAETPFNPASPKQCLAYFYGTKGIAPYLNPKTKKPTVDDTALSRIWRKYRLKEARLVQEIRKLQKLSGTYLEVVLDEDNRLRSSYNPRGSRFGRLSSSQTIYKTGMNMQNLHPEFSKLLISDSDAN